MVGGGAAAKGRADAAPPATSAAARTTAATAKRLLRMRSTLPPRAAGRNTYPRRRKDRYDVRSTADGCGRSSRAQMAVFSAARC
jgi:hypothetical protein